MINDAGVAVPGVKNHCLGRAVRDEPSKTRVCIACRFTIFVAAQPPTT